MVSLLLLGIAGPVAGQKLSLAPQIGFYIPTALLSETVTGGITTELEGGPSFGAQLGLWFGSRFGITATGSYIPTTFKATLGSQGVTTQDTKLFLGSGQVVLFLLPRSAAVTAFLNGGVGVISRGGVAFTSQSDNTNVTGVLGAGAVFNLGGISLTAGADLFAYSAGYQGAIQTSSETTKQKDVQIKLGLGIPFGGR
jgi:hypothetical protein